MENIDSHSVRLEFVRGDITRQDDIEAIVNAANTVLAPGGGVAGAIHRIAGPGLYEEARKLAPISPGQAVMTSAHDLPNKYVIHCLGPRYGFDEPEVELLASCYKNAFKVAEEKHIRSIAFPAISAGAFGFPIEEAAKIAVTTVKQGISTLKFLHVVRLHYLANRIRKFLHDTRAINLFVVITLHSGSRKILIREQQEMRLIGYQYIFQSYPYIVRRVCAPRRPL